MSEDRPKHSPSADSTFPLSRLSAPHTLVDVAREIEAADSVLSAVAAGKLESIARQIRALQEEAARTLAEARDAADLHRAQCSFKKIPGKLYHLYQRSSGERYFSMLSPEEWGSARPHAFLGTYRLEADMRFTKAEDLEQREREWAELRPLLSKQNG